MLQQRRPGGGGGGGTDDDMEQRREDPKTSSRKLNARDDDDDDDAKTSFPGKSDEEMYHRARAFCGGAVVRGAAPSRGQSRRDGRDEWRVGTV